MFTGIIEDIGLVQELQQKSGDRTLTIQTDKMDLHSTVAGDSIAVNGVCLTVVDKQDNCFTADVSAETLSKTTFKSLRKNSKVNLEKPLTLNTVLGGHMVSGHVDGVAIVISCSDDGRSSRYGFEVETSLAKYIAKKGSVCLDGVSLTVNNVSGNQFDVNVIPYTQQETIFHEYKVGSAVNLEVDIIARYLERLQQSVVQS